MPRFTVLVATYNRPELLGEALGSVLSQTFKEWECLVVDDCGDKPVVVPEDPRFRLLRTPLNSGAAGAWNLGLRVARGDWVCWLADDDRFAVNRLQLAVSALERGRIAVCADAPLERPNQVSGGGRWIDGDVRHRIMEGFVPSLGATAIPRAACPEFDLRFRGSEDLDWWLRAAHLLEVESRPEVGYLVRSHSGVRHGNGSVVRAACGQLLMAKHAAYFRSHPKARAFREQRIAALYLQARQPGKAVRHAARALRADPRPTRLVALGKTLAANAARRDPSS